MNLVGLSGGDSGVARRYAHVAGRKPACLTFLKHGDGMVQPHLPGHDLVRQ